MRRHQGSIARAVRWARHHPLAVRGLVMVAGVLTAWACEYATAGWALQVCQLRGKLSAQLVPLLEQALRGPGAAG